MTKTIVISAVIAAIIGVGTAYLIMSKLSKKQVAFVKSQVVLERYKGMDDAKVKYQQKLDDWQKMYDSIEHNFNMALQQYENKISGKQDPETKAALERQQQIVSSYAEEIEIKAKEENDKLTQGVLNQINEYIKNYAIANNIEIVLGVTLNGNILYGSETIDITDEIIEGINIEYSGKK